MKNPFFFVVFLLNSFLLSAQEWVEMKYDFNTQLNVVYGTATNFLGGTDTLKLDVYEPFCVDQSIVSKKPLLIWIHGGAFIAGDKSEVSITNLCKEFAQRGYVTASINYRLGFISDEAAWYCNFPSYSCVFATDSAEWYRAYYRAMQDAKGALRFLVNRSDEFNIDQNNVFVAGESAGAFIALGLSLLDTISEKPPQALAIADAPKPNNNTLNCPHNADKTFDSNTISRPDLGSIDGTIELSNSPFIIKGIGNMYGAMFTNLLKNHPINKPKPAIYSFHQPCDLVVPIDSAKIFAGLSWCMTNGYNCNGIGFTPKVYGSRTISQWNTTNNYGFNIQNEFTTTNFPFSFLLGSGSCLDQANNPCHAYENRLLRANNMAQFFAPLISTQAICDTALTISEYSAISDLKIRVYPNPAHEFVEITSNKNPLAYLCIYSIQGQTHVENIKVQGLTTQLNIKSLASGIYVLKCVDVLGNSTHFKLIKE